MNKKIFHLLLLLSSIVSACAANGLHEHPVILSPASQPVIDIAESRAMYLFSLARMRIIEGDLEGALTLLQAAGEADPEAA